MILSQKKQLNPCLKLAGLFFLSAIFMGGQLSAETNRYRLSLRADPTSTMVVGWNHINGSGATVYYDTVDHGQNYQSYDKSRGVDRSVSRRGMNNRFSRLSGLQSDTVYYFVIRDSNSVSSRMSFKTAPAQASEYSFVAGGDSRNNRTPRKNANRVVAKLRPLFVMFGGDFTSSDNDSQWQNWMDDWQLTRAADGRMFPIIAARGNHEDSNSVLVDLFDLPSSNAYYALSFGGNQLRTYTLNSEISAGGNQRSWLQNDLSSHQNVTWKISQYHKPMRPHTSSKSEGSDEYNNWAGLFYDYKVNLSIESDSHTVKRTFPVRPSNGSGSDEGFKQDDKGTVYIGEGCWGAPLRSNNDSKNWTRASGSFNQVSWVHVRSERLEIRTIKVDGSQNADSVDDAYPLQVPGGLDIWSPSGGSVVTILPQNTGNPGGDGTVSVRVSSSTDDAEQRSSGGMYLDSSDLELVNDGSRGNQKVGIRFRNISIPRGSHISKAYIQFTVDETGGASGDKTIFGELTGNAQTYSSASNNVSGRNYTMSGVLWSPLAWNNVGSAGDKQRTVDLSAIVQEIVDGSNWSTGNAMAFMIQGSGERVAESYDGSSSKAPLLYIEYTADGGGGDEGKNIGTNLGSNEDMNSGDWLESQNGEYRLYLQGDGNLVLRETATMSAKWASGTNGSGAVRLAMQSDGNLVLYTSTNSPVWASDTHGSGADQVLLNNNGSLAIYNGSNFVWSVNGTPDGGGGGPVSYTNKGGVNKTRSNISVTSTASNGDYELVSIGGSSVGGGNEKPIDSNLMLGQGFKLIGVRGTFDKKSEIWIRRNDGSGSQDTIRITGDGKDVAWSLTTIDGSSISLNTGNMPIATHSGNHGDGRSTAKLKTPGGAGFTFVALFFDDSTELTNSRGGDILYKTWGQGDGDGFAVVLYQPGETPPGTVDVFDHDNGTSGGEQYVTVAVNIDVIE